MNQLPNNRTVSRPVETLLGRSTTTLTSQRCNRPPTCKAIDPYLLQDISIGAVVIGAAGFSLAAGLGKEKVICDLCQGVGGSRCFGCQGNGKLIRTREQLDAIVDGDLEASGPPPRDFFGLAPEDPGKCKVCNGFGIIQCSRCKATGYV
jgi:hypothetical protein